MYFQERAQVKMVMIQDSNSPTAHDKPLRISGEPSKCQRAKEMVLELLAEKDNMPRPGGFNEFGSPVGPMGHGGGGGMDIGVPRQGVGLVIGKGGDMIKKIQTETGAKVQFKPGKKLSCLFIQGSGMNEIELQGMHRRHLKNIGTFQYTCY